MKSGIGCGLMLEMDDETFRRHFRLTREQYEVLNEKLIQIMGVEVNSELGGSTRIPQTMKPLVFLWYMANQNSFREMGDKFNSAQSTAHDVVIQVLGAICQMAPSYIKWPTACEKLIICWCLR